MELIFTGGMLHSIVQIETHLTCNADHEPVGKPFLMSRKKLRQLEGLCLTDESDGGTKISLVLLNLGIKRGSAVNAVVISGDLRSVAVSICGWQLIWTPITVRSFLWWAFIINVHHMRLRTKDNIPVISTLTLWWQLLLVRFWYAVANGACSTIISGVNAPALCYATALPCLLLCLPTTIVIGLLLVFAFLFVFAPR